MKTIEDSASNAMPALLVVLFAHVCTAVPSAPIVSAQTNAVGCVAQPSVRADLPPAVLAPAWNDFAARCAAKSATRGDLICLKRFIAASALEETAKKVWTQKARRLYQGMRSVSGDRRSEDRGQTNE